MELIELCFVVIATCAVVGVWSFVEAARARAEGDRYWLARQRKLDQREAEKQAKAGEPPCPGSA
jgi:hypothetical protein